MYWAAPINVFILGPLCCVPLYFLSPFVIAVEKGGGGTCFFVCLFTHVYTHSGHTHTQMCMHTHAWKHMDFLFLSLSFTMGVFCLCWEIHHQGFYCLGLFGYVRWFNQGVLWWWSVRKAVSYVNIGTACLMSSNTLCHFYTLGQGENVDPFVCGSCSSKSQL